MAYEFYYRFKQLGIDFTNEKEVKRCNEYLTSYSCLEPQFEKLNFAFHNETKEKGGVTVNILPNLCGVAEISACHVLKCGLLSRTVKKNCFSICISKYDENDELNLYFYETEYLNEVEQIFKDLIERHSIPDLTDWEKEWIG